MIAVVTVVRSVEGTIESTTCVPVRFLVGAAPGDFTSENLTVDPPASADPMFLTTEVSETGAPGATVTGAPATVTDLTMRSGSAVTSTVFVDSTQLSSFDSG